MGILLKVCASVCIPVSCAILISCVFYPLVKGLTYKTKIPWALSSIIMALLFLIIIMGLFGIIGRSAFTFLDQYSKYEDKFLSIYKIVADTLHISFDGDKTFLENLGTQINIRKLFQDAAIALSGGIATFLKSTMVVLLFSVFFLIEMRHGKEKINFIFKTGVQGRVLSLTKKIISQVMRFLSIKFFISLITGALVWFICFITNLDFPILWAFLAFILNFIPTFGSIFSVGIITIFAILQFYPSPLRTLVVFAGVTGVNLILGNVIEPKVEGDNLDISPFVILVSLTFWGWMWGVVGMIIAVPLMVILKIVFANISFFHPVAILLGNKPEKTLKELSIVETDDEVIQSD